MNPMREAAPYKTSLTKLADALQRSSVIAGATLREIFDENAYARFLRRHSLSASVTSYAQFLEENKVERERRPKCC